MKRRVTSHLLTALVGLLASTAAGGGAAPGPIGAGQATTRAEATVLSWEPAEGASGYHIRRWNAGDPADRYYLAWTEANHFTDTTPRLPGSVWFISASAPGNLRGPELRLDVQEDPRTAQECRDCESYQTELINGRWELVDRHGERTAWQGINVRSDLPGGLDAIDDPLLLQLAAAGFNVVRVPLHWADLQPSAGRFDPSAVRALDRFIDRADVAGLGVVLDPLHLGNSAWIPDWAWAQAWSHPKPPWTSASTDPASDKDPDDSLEVLAYRPAEGDDSAIGYLAAILSRYSNNPAVIALELVSEPHPFNGRAWDTTNELADLQAAWVEELRLVDPDKPLVITGYYGGFLANSDALASAFIRDSGEPRYSNLVFTAHTYFTGITSVDNRPFDANGDGFGDLDLPESWRRGSKQGIRAEDYRSRGCYATALVPAGTGAFACPLPSVAQRTAAQSGLERHLQAQDRVAQKAGMPLFVGEVGTHPVRQTASGWFGWGNADLMACDQLNALLRSAETAISFAVWDLHSGGFGWWSASSGTWTALGVAGAVCLTGGVTA